MIHYSESIQMTPCKHPTNADKWRYTLYTTIIFLIIVNPWTYKLVQSILKGVVKIANADGCPTMTGIFVHAAVFTVLLRIMMDWDI